MWRGSGLVLASWIPAWGLFPRPAPVGLAIGRQARAPVSDQALLRVSHEPACAIELPSRRRGAVIAPVAQWIEHLTSDQKVGGSSPSGRANRFPETSVSDVLEHLTSGAPTFLGRRWSNTALGPNVFRNGAPLSRLNSTSPTTASEPSPASRLVDGDAKSLRTTCCLRVSQQPVGALDLPGSTKAPVAQRIEHLTTDQKVGSSNLSGRASSTSRY
jgi:hypothetical protein